MRWLRAVRPERSSTWSAINATAADTDSRHKHRVSEDSPAQSALRATAADQEQRTSYLRLRRQQSGLMAAGEAAAATMGKPGRRWQILLHLTRKRATAAAPGAATAAALLARTARK